jgi:hypothetical protein
MAEGRGAIEIIGFYAGSAGQGNRALHIGQLPRLAARSIVEDVVDYDVDAVSQMTPVPLSRGQKLTGLVGAFGLHAPFLGARHVQGGVERLQLGL